MLLLLCGLAAGCGNSNADTTHVTLPEVAVMKLTSNNVTLPREYLCEVKAVQYVEVRARVQGYLEQIYIDEGSRVKEGQPLFRLSSHEYQEQVVKAEANVRRAKAEAKTKSVNVERITTLVDKKIISTTELDVARAQLDAAESAVSEAISMLQNAKINLGYTHIDAPFDGVVDLIPFKRGSLVNSGTLLTSVSNIDHVYAYFRVTEAEYIRLRKAELKNDRFGEEQSSVKMILADGSAFEHPGIVETIEGDFDPSTGSIAIRARFPNPERMLKHGSSGKIIMNKTISDAILIPQESTFSIQDKNYVYVVDKDNIAHVRSFLPIARTAHEFVVDGLIPGDRIVVEGLSKLKDGMKVVPRKPRDRGAV
jgi:membrane fusion protein (multidrug efflux system)